MAILLLCSVQARRSAHTVYSMSAATPAPSNPSSDSPSPENPPAKETPSSENVDQLIISYLHERGHRGAERALREVLNLPQPDEDEYAPPESTVSDAELGQPTAEGKNPIKEICARCQGLSRGRQLLNAMNFSVEFHSHRVAVLQGKIEN